MVCAEPEEAVNPTDPVLQLIAGEARVRPPHVFHLWHAMRSLGKGFHAGAFAQFSGLEERHVLRIIAALTDHNCLPDGRAKVERRAARLPDDWTPPAEWIEWAVLKRHWTPAEAHEEAEIFASYWQARAGAQAAKLDWFKTWQNWVRQSRRPDGEYVPGNGPVDRATYLRQAIRTYERMGREGETGEWRRELAQLSEESNVVHFTNRKIS